MDRIDMKISSSGDIEIEDNNIAFVSNRDVYIQCLQQVLMTRAGEFFLDINEGLDHTNILGVKNPDSELIYDAIYLACSQVEEFVEIQEYEFTYNQQERLLKIDLLILFADLNDEGQIEITTEVLLGG